MLVLVNYFSEMSSNKHKKLSRQQFLLPIFFDCQIKTIMQKKQKYFCFLLRKTKNGLISHRVFQEEWQQG